MAELPSHEDLERVFETEPRKILDQFKGDDYRVKRAKDNLDIAYQYAKDLREDRKADRP